MTRNASAGPAAGAPSNWALIRRLLAMAWQYRWGCVRVILLQVTLVVLGMLGLGLVGLGIDHLRYERQRAIDGPAAVSTGLAGPSLPQSLPGDATARPVAKPPRWPLGLAPPAAWSPIGSLAAVSLAILLFAVVRTVLNALYAVTVTRLVQGQIVVNLRAQVYRKMQRLSFRFFDANASGGIINRVTGDVQSVRSFVDGVVVQSLILLLSLVFYIVYMTHIHVGLTLACLATTPLLWYATVRFSRTVRPAYMRNRDLFDSQILAVSENAQGVHVVKGFALQEEENRKFGRAADAVREQKRWIFDKVSTFQPTVGLLSHVNLVVMLIYGGLLVMAFERAPDAETAASVGISIGQLLVFVGLLQQFSGQVANIATIADSMQQSLTGAQRVFEVLDAPVEVKAPTNATHLPTPRGEIAFEHVTFAYKDGEPALADISFRVAPGQCVAILGATGAGKTTLLSMLPRFYDPQQGVVRVDGFDVRTLDLDDLRRSIGVVFQESFLFSNTIRANIAFGAPDATQEQVERAATVAAAHEFIVDLPQGYDTMLREGGTNLSGGQRQRLAIARALLLEPKILLLDDPTAAIDPNTEADILNAMERAMQGRTTFMVAHRLSTLRRADLVLVLNNGRIVQTGTHEELMQQQGHYRHAASLQEADATSLRLLEKGDRKA